VKGESDQSAQFIRLMEEYTRPLRRLCAAYADRSADREDLFQDILLAVWRALPAYRGDASIRTWLYRIAHNVALTWKARHRRRQHGEIPLHDAQDTGTETNLRRLALTRAIATLSPADRALILLWLEGLSAAEIEAVTGVKAATVAVRLGRIRRSLQPIEEKS
jgi:RNA polymerase sigma factor (sigma-70 family)